MRHSSDGHEAAAEIASIRAVIAENDESLAWLEAYAQRAQRREAPRRRDRRDRHGLPDRTGEIEDNPTLAHKTRHASGGAARATALRPERQVQIAQATAWARCRPKK